jgi:hypothetical protein
MRKRGCGNRGCGRRVYLHNKRGQITIFIIVGIVVLFTFAGILFLTKSTTEEKLTAAGEPVLTAVPQTFQPISTYTENCLEQVGERGLRLLGEQGGYIYPDLVAEFTENPTESDGITLTPLSVPYWHYNHLPNGGDVIQFASLQPPLYITDDHVLSVEAQLSRFTEEQLAGCLRAYTPFTKQGFLISQGQQQEVEVQIAEETVNFLLTMPLDVQKGEAVDTIEQFFVKIPLPLLHYFEVAEMITQAEKDHDFLEKQGLELLAIYSGKDADSFPPTAETGFQILAPIAWEQSALQQDYKTLLTSYVPFLRFLGSTNFYHSTFTGSAVAQKIVDNMVLPLSGAEDLGVSFNYLGWEPYFSANSDEGVIQPEHTFVNYGLLSFGFQRYETNYDISYPVLVTLQDKYAFSGSGYTFNFALESNIRNNLPAVEGAAPEQYPVGISSLACNENQKNTEVISAVVVDSFSQEPLELVKVGFTIPDQDECEIGFTDVAGSIEDTYPAVYGGVGNFIKEEYLTAFYPIDTYKYQEEPGIMGYAVAHHPQQVIEMHRKKTVNVSALVRSLEKCIGDKCHTRGLFGGGDEVFSYTPEMLDNPHRWIMGNAQRELIDGENVNIILTRVRDIHPQIKHAPHTATVTIVPGEKSEMDLYPGVYDVNVVLTNDNPLVIPDAERCTGGVLEVVACFDIPGQTLEQYLAGQVEWNDEDTYITITPEQLYGSEEIKFHVLAFNMEGVPQQANVRVSEDFQVMGELGRISREQRENLLPVFR